MTNGCESELKVAAINICLSNGVTEPLRCTLNNGIEAVVKYPNNVEGNLILLNEYISYHIATQIGLNIPHAGLCILDGDCTNESDKELTEENHGIAFYSTFIRKAVPFTPGLVSRMINLDKFPDLVLFDHIIYNKDRHQGNVIMSMTNPSQYYIIDHSHVFKNEAIWDARTFRTGIVEDDYLDKAIIESNSFIYDAFRSHIRLSQPHLKRLCCEIQGEISDDYLRNLKATIPPAWADEIGTTNIDALMDYINYRVSNLDKICDMVIFEGGRI